LLASGSFTDRNRLFVISRCPHRQESPKRKRGYMAELVCGLLGIAQLIKLLSVSGVPLVQAMAVNYSIGYSIQFYINWFADRIGEWSLDRARLELLARTKIPTPMKVDFASNAVACWFLFFWPFMVVYWLSRYDPIDQMTHRQFDVAAGLGFSIVWAFSLAASILPWPQAWRYPEEHTYPEEQPGHEPVFFLFSLGVVGLALAEILVARFRGTLHSESAQISLTSIAFVLSILLLILFAIAVKRDTSPWERWHRFWTVFILFANIAALTLYFTTFYDWSLTTKPAWADYLG
jgi:predicted membrane channel-forming protein YqfA (hemolysin III family)